MKYQYTPEYLTDLERNEIFVFGSNTEGRHGKGAALIAKKHFGAKYGQAKGLQGRSYAIITKDLSKGFKSIPLSVINEQILELYDFAKQNTHLTFYVTKIGCSLGGYRINDIAAQFNLEIQPENIILPKEFVEFHIKN